MKACLAVLCLIATCLAQTTHHPHHHTHEPNEGESFTFAYNGRSHDLLVRRTANKMYSCYIVTVTADERQMVHTDSGMRALELRALGELSTATKVDMSTVDQANLRLCGHAPHNGTMTYYTVM